MLYIKLSRNEKDIAASISNSDYTEEIINDISNSIYQKNLIHVSNHSCQKTVNDYLTSLKKMKNLKYIY